MPECGLVVIPVENGGELGERHNRIAPFGNVGIFQKLQPYRREFFFLFCLGKWFFVGFFVFLFLRIVGILLVVASHSKERCDCQKSQEFDIHNINIISNFRLIDAKIALNVDSKKHFSAIF